MKTAEQGGIEKEGEDQLVGRAKSEKDDIFYEEKRTRYSLVDPDPD